MPSSRNPQSAMVVSPLIAPTIKLEDGSTVDSVGTSTGFRLLHACRAYSG
jgi:hypothetical protein